MGEQLEDEDVGSAPAGELKLTVLSQATGYALRRAQMWSFRDLKARFKPHDISPAQYAVLDVVAENPGLAQARVAEALSIERARLVLMLDRLEERQLLVRVRSTSDRRTHELHLTDKGRELLAELYKLWEEHERKIEELIGSDGQAALLKLLAPMQ